MAIASLAVALLCAVSTASSAADAPREVRVAAANSPVSQKAAADFVCTGTNDERVINEAIGRLVFGGTVRLADGDYFVDAFEQEGNSAICFGYNGGSARVVRLAGTTDNKGYNTRVARSRDLKSWEFSPHVVLDYDQDDRKIHPAGRFNAKELAEIASAVNINASDLDMCEFGGRLVCFYSWGNQRGKEYSALAEADCTEREFCESFFSNHPAFKTN